MCSIAGIFSTSGEAETIARLQQMNRSLAHRGPDAEGYFTNIIHDRCIGLAHNRLAIIDRTEASAQPFRFNHLTMVYNGALYNYKEIRDTLIQKGYTFQSSGDTEVLIKAYHAYGRSCVDHFDGMFAFAILDNTEGIVFCARDRFGEKPFYFQHNETTEFRFASELSALLDIGTNPNVDETMLYQYLTHGFTKIPYQPWRTFYQNVFQLPPAHTLTYSIHTDSWEITAYWDLDKETIEDRPDAVAHFKDVFFDSVKKRLRADVTIGTLLSGGIDSSSIAAVIAQYQQNYKTFSAIFPRFEKDESSKIQTVADHLALNAYTIIPSSKQFAERISDVIFHHREPIGSASVFAQYLVYEKAAAEGVKVIIDGQGADESLAGYRKYTHWYLQELIRTIGWKEATKQAGAFKSNHYLDQWGIKNYIASYFCSLTALQLEKKVLQEQRNCFWLDPDFADHAKDRMAVQKPIVEKLNDIQYFDLMVMGLEELLRYADRNSMANGIEVRLPFLSHQLVQYIFNLPTSYRMHNGYTKWILRETMKPFLPEEIIWQKNKIGFEPPQALWMEQEGINEQTIEAMDRLKRLGIIRPLKKELTTTERFRILVAGSLLA